MTSDEKLRPGINKVLGCVPFFYRYFFINDVVGHPLACDRAVSSPDLLSGCTEWIETVT